MPETIFGDRLHQARVLRQRKLADLADMLECSVPTLSKWERSREIDFSSSQLDRVTENLRFSPLFFFTRPSPPLSDSDLLFKAPKTTLKREISWLREFVRLTSELVDWLDERRHLPPVKVSLTSKDSPRTVDAAQEMRAMLGIPNVTPIEYLTHPAERAGIVVVVRRRALSDGWAGEWESHHEERHEGCSAWIGEFRERPLILMRNVPTWEKTRWVLAHELGHLYLHAGRTLVSEAAEEQASRFASELLAPIDQLVLELPRVVTLTALLKLKFKWGISLAALIRHLHGNDVISDQRRKTLYDQLYTRRNPETGRSFGVTEPGWDQRSPERPRLIAAWSKHITGSLVPEAIASASGIFPPDLLMSILNEQRGAPRRSAPPPSGGSVGKVIPLKERQAEKDSEMKRFRA